MIEQILEWISTNKDSVEVIINALTLICGGGIFVAIIGGIYQFALWIIKERRKSKIGVDTFPFEVIKPQGNLLEYVYPGKDDDPLAEKNIPYRNRIDQRNIRRELEDLLLEKRWLLIVGRTGVGKTREAVNLAQILNNEGWTILYLTRNEWFDVPRKLDPRIGTDKKIIFLLDDLNKQVFASKAEEYPRAAEEMLAPITIPFQNRMRSAFEKYEILCGGKDSYVIIATARNEPSEWKKLEYEKYSHLWSRFTICEIPDPDTKPLAHVMNEAANRAGITINIEECLSLVKSSDYTFTTIIENLVSARNRKKTLNQKNFIPTLSGTWEKKYNLAVEKYPGAKYVYDAIDLLRDARINIHDFTVEMASHLIADGNIFMRVIYRQQIRKAMKYLVKWERILNPSDGQIEGKGYKINIKDYILPQSNLSSLTKNVLRLFNRHPTKMLSSVYKFGSVLLEFEQFGQLKVLMNKTVELFPQEAHGYLLRGWSYHELDNYPSALTDYSEAIKLDAQLAQAYSDRGILYANMEKRSAALADFSKAIELDPYYSTAYYNRGKINGELDNNSAALADYSKAIELDSIFAYAYNNRGRIYYDMEDFTMALADFTKAIKLDPQLTRAFYNRGQTNYAQENFPAALADYTETIEQDPYDAKAYINRGSTYIHLEDYLAALADFSKAIDELDLPDARAYSFRGSVYFKLENYQAALADYSKAIEMDPLDAKEYSNRGINFFELKDFPAALTDFSKAIELDPNFAQAYTNRGMLNDKMEDYAAALADYSKAIEMDPLDDKNYYNIACIYSLQKNTKLACKWLGKAIELDVSNLELVDNDTDFDAIRTDPNFVGFLEMLKDIK